MIVFVNNANLFLCINSCNSNCCFFLLFDLSSKDLVTQEKFPNKKGVALHEPVHCYFFKNFPMF